MSTNWSLMWQLLRKWKLPMSNSKDALTIQRALRRQAEYLRIEVKQQKQINCLLKRRILKQDELLSSLSRRIEMDGKLIEDFVRGNVTAPDSNLFLDLELESESNVDSIPLKEGKVEKIHSSTILDDPSLKFTDEELEKSIYDMAIDTEIETEMETPKENEDKKIKKFKRQIPVKNERIPSFVKEKKARVHS